MAEKVVNQITKEQFIYLNSQITGKPILPCWAPDQGPINIRPNSPNCILARYEARVYPCILTTIFKGKLNQTDLLARACSICPIMAQAIAKIPTPIT